MTTIMMKIKTNTIMKTSNDQWAVETITETAAVKITPLCYSVSSLSNVHTIPVVAEYEWTFVDGEVNYLCAECCASWRKSAEMQGTTAVIKSIKTIRPIIGIDPVIIGDV